MRTTLLSVAVGLVFLSAAFPASVNADCGIGGESSCSYGAALDNVSVTVAPELSTWVMMLLGFAGIALVAYLRSRKSATAGATVRLSGGFKVRTKVKAVLSGALFAAVLGAGAAKAGVIPYPNIGTANPVIYNFTADYTGEVIAYFYTSSAAYNETIGLLVNGVSTGITGLPNHGSAFGQPLDLGFAHGGDTLVFSLHVSTTSDVFFSNPGLNVVDHFNHVYATPYSGGGGIPAGTFLAFEDLRGGGDKDYNDTSFVFASGVPEMSTWAMMLIGFGGIGLLAYRRSRNNNGRAPASA